MVWRSDARVRGDLQRTVSVHGGLREQFARLDTTPRPSFHLTILVKSLIRRLDQIC
jgi:hypothetical protein